MGKRDDGFAIIERSARQDPTSHAASGNEQEPTDCTERMILRRGVARSSA
ncbi:hypothetical protein [Amycolatopsis pretoriensis]|nr:hypothetical protein [Amycolatopsis pretoriensis]